MPEVKPSTNAVSRIWVMNRSQLVDGYNGDYWDEEIDLDYGFFLLEADGLAKADELNKSTKDQYVQECQEAALKVERGRQAHDEAVRRNEVLVANGFDPLPVKRYPQAYVAPSFEEYVRRNMLTIYEPVEMLPGEVKQA